MHSPAELLRELQDAGVDLFCGVPDSLLRPFCDLLTPLPPDRHVITANEGAAVALAMGHYLGGGGLPLVYLQNSGLGNAVNPLLSLADPLVYGIPLLLLVGWRGEPGVPDEPQHAKQGAVTPALLDAMDIPCRVLDRASSGPRQLVREAVGSSLGRGGPHALLVRKGALGPSTSAARAADAAWSREAALAQVLERLHGDDLVVATTGFTGRELFEQRRARGEGHARDLLVIGGMGHASQIALGLALRQPRRRVICLDGDGR
jgi:phosphonopyruvate decarboxylase